MPSVLMILSKCPLDFKQLWAKSSTFRRIVVAMAPIHTWDVTLTMRNSMLLVKNSNEVWGVPITSVPLEIQRGYKVNVLSNNIANNMDALQTNVKGNRKVGLESNNDWATSWTNQLDREWKGKLQRNLEKKEQKEVKRRKVLAWEEEKGRNDKEIQHDREREGGGREKKGDVEMERDVQAERETVLQQEKLRKWELELELNREREGRENKRERFMDRKRDRVRVRDMTVAEEVVFERKRERERAREKVREIETEMEVNSGRQSGKTIDSLDDRGKKIEIEDLIMTSDHDFSANRWLDWAKGRDQIKTINWDVRVKGKPLMDTSIESVDGQLQVKERGKEMVSVSSKGTDQLHLKTVGEDVIALRERKDDGVVNVPHQGKGLNKIPNKEIVTDEIDQWKESKRGRRGIGVEDMIGCRTTVTMELNKEITLEKLQKRVKGETKIISSNSAYCNENRPDNVIGQSVEETLDRVDWLAWAKAQHRVNEVKAVENTNGRTFVKVNERYPLEELRKNDAKAIRVGSITSGMKDNMWDMTEEKEISVKEKEREIEREYVKMKELEELNKAHVQESIITDTNKNKFEKVRCHTICGNFDPISKTDRWIDWAFKDIMKVEKTVLANNKADINITNEYLDNGTEKKESVPVIAMETTEIGQSRHGGDAMILIGRQRGGYMGDVDVKKKGRNRGQEREREIEREREKNTEKEKEIEREILMKKEREIERERDSERERERKIEKERGIARENILEYTNKQKMDKGNNTKKRNRQDMGQRTEKVVDEGIERKWCDWAGCQDMVNDIESVKFNTDNTLVGSNKRNGVEEKNREAPTVMHSIEEDRSDRIPDTNRLVGKMEATGVVKEGIGFDKLGIEHISINKSKEIGVNQLRDGDLREKVDDSTVAKWIDWVKRLDRIHSITFREEVLDLALIGAVNEIPNIVNDGQEPYIVKENVNGGGGASEETVSVVAMETERERGILFLPNKRQDMDRLAEEKKFMSMTALRQPIETKKVLIDQKETPKGNNSKNIPIKQGTEGSITVMAQLKDNLWDNGKQGRTDIEKEGIKPKDIIGGKGLLDPSGDQSQENTGLHKRKEDCIYNIKDQSDNVTSDHGKGVKWKGYKNWTNKLNSTGEIDNRVITDQSDEILNQSKLVEISKDGTPLGVDVGEKDLNEVQEREKMKEEKMRELECDRAITQKNAEERESIATIEKSLLVIMKTITTKYEKNKRRDERREKKRKKDKEKENERILKKALEDADSITDCSFKHSLDENENKSEPLDFLKYRFKVKSLLQVQQAEEVVDKYQKEWSKVVPIPTNKCVKSNSKTTGKSSLGWTKKGVDTVEDMVVMPKEREIQEYEAQLEDMAKIQAELRELSLKQQAHLVLNIFTNFWGLAYYKSQELSPKQKEMARVAEEERKEKNRLYCLSLNNTVEKITQRLDTIPANDPNRYYYLNNRAVTYEKLKNNDKALLDYNAALSIRPEDPAAYFYRSSFHLTNRQIDLAQKDVVAGLLLDPTHSELQGLVKKII
eukprot:Ihof_evm2s566 gene=Ihof_evmTU2s566